MSAEPAPSRGHEGTGLRFRAVLFSAVALGVLIVAAMWAMEVMFDRLEAGWAKRDLPPAPLAETVERPAVPFLQTQPLAELQILRRGEEAQLENYQWIDPEQNIVRIPIERAIDILAEKGLPHREKEGE